LFSRGCARFRRKFHHFYDCSFLRGIVTIFPAGADRDAV
jgi:hypothetical protein